MVQSAFLRRPLAELLLACAEASLDLIVLKGAALAETVYERPSLRPFGDIDVLVRLGDAARASALLSGLGYAVDPALWTDLASGRSCEANFFRITALGSVVIELHTDLLNNALLRRQVSVDQDGLWARSHPALLAGQEARVLGPEDQLLHLCLHLAGHYFDAPQSVRDIGKVCAAHLIDWPLFVSLCQAAHAETIGWSGLFAASLRGAEVPPSSAERLAPGRHRRLIEGFVTAQVLNGPAPGSDAGRFLLMWLVLGSGRGRLHALRHLCFPPQAWLRSHYFYDYPKALGLPSHLPLYWRHLSFLTGSLWKMCRKTGSGTRTLGRSED